MNIPIIRLKIRGFKVLAFIYLVEMMAAADTGLYAETEYELQEAGPNADFGLPEDVPSARPFGLVGGID